MRWKVGGLLIVASVVLMVITSAEAIKKITPLSLHEGRLVAQSLGFLLTETVLVLVFLAGRRLWRRSPAELAEAVAVARTKHPRPWSLYLYLGGAFLVAMFATFLPVWVGFPRPLYLLIEGPWVFISAILAFCVLPRLGSIIDGRTMFTATHVLYFMALFYPLYRISTMDRVAEVARYQRMKVVLVLFMIIHLSAAAVYAIW